MKPNISLLSSFFIFCFSFYPYAQKLSPIDDELGIYRFAVLQYPSAEICNQLEFKFKTKGRGTAHLTIFDSEGNLLHENRTSFSCASQDDAEYFSLPRWDMRNAQGRKVSDGTYMAFLKLLIKDGSGRVLKTLFAIR